MGYPACPHCADSISFAKAKIVVGEGTAKMDAIYCVRCKKIITVFDPNIEARLKALESESAQRRPKL